MDAGNLKSLGRADRIHGKTLKFWVQILSFWSHCPWPSTRLQRGPMLARGATPQFSHRSQYWILRLQIPYFLWPILLVPWGSQYNIPWLPNIGNILLKEAQMAIQLDIITISSHYWPALCSTYYPPALPVTQSNSRSLSQLGWRFS